MKDIKLFYAFLCIANCLWCCSPKKNGQQRSYEKIDNSCFEARKVVKQIKDQNGEVMSINDVYLLKISESSRFLVCELPNIFSKEGLLVEFSGEILQIAENERLMGTPLRLKQIKLK